ncbi:MAG: MBL fold metallo-hydrolase [Myxococcota bacterium]
MTCLSLFATGLALAAPVKGMDAPVPAYPDVLTIDSELTVTRVDHGIYIFQSQPWDANSLLVVNSNGDAVLVDTPALPRTTRTLLDWAAKVLGIVPKAAVNSHYHMDASGGNQVLKTRRIPIYASAQTRQMLADRGNAYRDELIGLFEKHPSVREGLSEIKSTLPDETIATHGTREFHAGMLAFRLQHHGPTHSPDHISVYFPKERVLYGGCAVRHGDTLGNIREAKNFSNWRHAILQMQAFKPQVVVPGHDSNYTPELLNNTVKLLDDQIRHSAASVGAVTAPKKTL